MNVIKKGKLKNKWSCTQGCDSSMWSKIVSASKLISSDIIAVQMGTVLFKNLVFDQFV